MNKRIFFVLLPLLAILFGYSGLSGDAPVAKLATGISFNGSSFKANSSHTVSLTKDDTHQKKNKIRIKAWDHFSEIDNSATWEPYTRIVYYNRAAYNAYQAYFLSAHFTRYNLRGPPTVNS